MARIRAANFTSCARAPLQDNETIHKLSTVSPPLSLPSTVPPPFAISLLLCFLPPPLPSAEISQRKFIPFLLSPPPPPPDNVNFYRVVETRQIGRLRFLELLARYAAWWKHQKKTRAALLCFPRRLVDACLPSLSGKLEQRVSTYYSPVFFFLSFFQFQTGKILFSRSRRC